jgi:hypothetical protein
VNKPTFPLGIVLVSSVATLFMGAGAIGLLAPDMAPPFARPAVAWSLIGVGIVLDIGAVLQLIRRSRST